MFNRPSFTFLYTFCIGVILGMKDHAYSGDSNLDGMYRSYGIPLITLFAIAKYRENRLNAGLGYGLGMMLGYYLASSPANQDLKSSITDNDHTPRFGL